MKNLKEKSRKHIVMLGESGFPVGLATIQRMTLMGRSFLDSGCAVTVICRKGVWDKPELPNFKEKGNFEGIDYVYTSKTVIKPKGFFKRNYSKLKGIYGEFKFLRNLKKHNHIDLVVVSELKVLHILRYIITSKFIRVPVSTNLVEMASSMEHRSKLSKKINDYLHDKYIVKFYDGALPISDSLKEFYNAISPSKPNMKLPILCDFEKFNISKSDYKPYLLYCGSFRYKEVRDFIVEAYKRAEKNNNIALYMIVSGGNKIETELLQKELNLLFTNNQIKIFSNIPYQQLIELYVNAKALLIPLRNTVQDASRFPHKIGEYLASGNPVITTNVGEIKNYFKDEETALIADKYDIEMYTEKINFVLNHPLKAEKIGLAGKELGLREFHYRAHSDRLKNFILQFKSST